MATLDITPQGDEYQTDFHKLNAADVKSEVAVPTSTAQVVSQTSAFVRKSLHPPTAVPDYNGIPTLDSRGSCVQVERRGLRLLQQPSTIVDGTVQKLTPEQLGNFAMGFLTLNGARVNNIAFVRDSNGVWLQDHSNVDVVTNYDFTRFSRDAQNYRITYKSTTRALNVTAFNDVGFCTESQFNPNILFQGSVNNLAMNHPKLFHALIKTHIKSGHIVENTRPNGAKKLMDDYVMVKNDATVVNKFDLPHYMIEDCIMKTGVHPNNLHLAANQNMQIIFFGQAPSQGYGANIEFTMDSIMMLSAKNYTGPAREGLFAVQRLNTLSPSFRSSGNEDPVNGQYLCYYAYFDSSGQPHIVPFSENTAPGTPVANIKTLYDTEWTSDFTCSICLFDGLSLNPQTYTSFQVISTKTISGLEIQPSLTSPWAGIQRPGPPPDLASIQKLLDAFYVMKDSMPSRYNFLGGLINLATGALSKIGDGVVENLSKKMKDTKISKPKKEVKELKREEKKAKKVIKKAEAVVEEQRNPPARPRRQPQPAPPRRYNNYVPRNNGRYNRDNRGQRVQPMVFRNRNQRK